MLLHEEEIYPSQCTEALFEDETFKIDDCDDVVENVPVGLSVSGVRSHLRMNLAVPYAQCTDAQQLGALFDMSNEVFYVPPRTDLIPFSPWLPFDVHSVSREADGFLSPGIQHSAGPTKQDGSPDFRVKINRDSRQMSSPPQAISFSPDKPSVVIDAPQRKIFAAPVPSVTSVRPAVPEAPTVVPDIDTPVAVATVVAVVASEPVSVVPTLVPEVLGNDAEASPALAVNRNDPSVPPARDEELVELERFASRFVPIGYAFCGVIVVAIITAFASAIS